MSDLSAVPLPQWLIDMPLDSAAAQRKRTRFMLRLAALYASEAGTLSMLSELCQQPTRIFPDMASSPNMRTIPPVLAKRIERAVGAHICPRELLNPEVFGE